MSTVVGDNAGGMGALRDAVLLGYCCRVCAPGKAGQHGFGGRLGAPAGPGTCRTVTRASLGVTGGSLWGESITAGPERRPRSDWSKWTLGCSANTWVSVLAAEFPSTGWILPWLAGHGL